MEGTLHLLTAGESHGKALCAILDGLPAGIPISERDIDRDLARRQLGFGRGARMDIERDHAEILSGVRWGKTIGAPTSLLIRNKDYPNWEHMMAVEPRGEGTLPPETKPRPGHGDLAGCLKYQTLDARDVLERASARETAARTAAGALARALLKEVGVEVVSRVLQIGGVSIAGSQKERLSIESFVGADDDPVRCTDGEVSALMIEEIKKADEDGDSLGGVFQVAAFGVPPGLGSFSEFSKRLDARLFCALSSIPSVKGVEVGEGFGLAYLRGSSAHDEIFYSKEIGVFRKTNRAGGLEAGLTNGEPIVLNAAMKPIPTLKKPLATVDIERCEPALAMKERADVCVVPAAGVIGEAMVCLVLAEAFIEKFGGDSLGELEKNMGSYLKEIARLWVPKRGLD
ncbi:MAG: chorismate synthase [Actinomycetota bacterium]|nr:chorismate synthase [Actinomycetota bacterium]